MKVLTNIVVNMLFRLAGWFGLISVILISLLGFSFYFAILLFLIFFIIGLISTLYFCYGSQKNLSPEFNCPDDPLQLSHFTVTIPRVLEYFQKETSFQKFDTRITGCETIDTFLNEIITIIINDYVTPWYEILTNDEEFATCTIKHLVLITSANVSNRVKCVDWIHLLSTKFPEEFTTHLKLFKQSQVRLKHINLLHAKDINNGNSRTSPKAQDEKRTHRRNKSDTDISWSSDSLTCGKSKFYDSAENINGNTLKDIFFNLESSIENKQLCRDAFCMDSEKEYALLCEISEAVLYLVAPDEVWRCHALKLILLQLLSTVVLRPLLDILSDPDNINRAIIRTCCKDSCLQSELFLLVIRCCSDCEELDAVLELVQKDIQKLHSRDSAGEWELQDRQKLSSLQYVSRIIQARKATLGPQEDSTTSANEIKLSEEVTRSLKFLRDITAWRSNAQYLLDIELNDADLSQTSKVVIDNLRSSALELCDLYLAPSRPQVMGVPENCHSDLVRKITTDGEEFTNNPVVCFEEIQKCVCDALEEDPSWQSDFMMDNYQDNSEKSSDLKKDDKEPTKKYSEKCKRIMKTCLNRLPKLFHKTRYQYHEPPMKSFTFPRSCEKRTPCNKNHTLPKCRTCDDVPPAPGMRHNRSRSDIVGSFAQQMIKASAGATSLSASSTSSNLSALNTEISQTAKNYLSPLSASIIETAVMQEKGRAFGIYAIAVTRLSDNEVWHIYRRYSDFYDLHNSIKEKWPEIANIPFPAKKTFQNTSRSVLENRKRMLNTYLQKLTSLAKETRYMALLSQQYLGGFLSPEIQAEKHTNTIDALLVNSLRAGMRTLKNMPDQFANTVDGVMDGISKVFQSKPSDSYYETLKSGGSSDGQDQDDESAALRLLEEVLGIRGLWLRRRLLAPLRTLIADRVNRKVLEFVSSLTSPRNVVQYLKSFKQWLKNRNSSKYSTRDSLTKARTRVAAKVALLSACSDDLKHIVGTDTARRGLLTVFDLFQTQEINKRLIFVLLEVMLINLFPDNNIKGLFKKLYTNSPRVPPPRKPANI